MFKELRDRAGFNCIGIAFAIVAALNTASPASAQTAPSLGSAQSFAVLAASTVTNTGPSIVTGDLGVSLGPAVTGFPPGAVVLGAIHDGDATAIAAQGSLTTAYNDLVSQACTVDLTGQDLGGRTLTAGVYCFVTSAQLTGTLTLDAQGNANAVFIFKMGTTLTTAAASSVVLINGESLCNVFWQVGSSATLGANTSFAGNVLALTSITMGAGASVTGRVLARNGAVTMDNNAATVPCPAAAPTVALTAPAANATVSGLTAVSATASAALGVAGVQFQLDGAPLGAEDVTAPYSVSWTTTTATNGLHALTAVVRDVATNQTTSAAVSVTVANDTTPPAVALTAPAANATVSGAVTVTATASDSAGVAGVQFQLDGAPLGAEDVTAPYSVSWTTTTATTGLHTLTAVARDAATNQTTSAARSITVDKTFPVIAAVAVSSITAAGATFTWTTDEASDTQVNYGLTTAYGTNTTLVAADVTSHSVVRSGLTPNTTYHFRVRSRDAAVPGNLTLSGDFTFTTLDGTAPTVALTAPAANATVSGLTTVSATASDSVGVAGVQFRLDGAPLGPEAVAAPYATSWDTTTAADGVHTLTAVARDAATNQTTSAARTVTVANDLTPPVVSAVGASSITVAGATIAWTTNEASDSQVEYGVTTAYGSASALNASLVTSHSMGLSGLAANTTYHYRVRSEDAAGNLATSADFTFTTLAGGDVTPPTVSVSAPSPGATVSGTVTISATAADAVGVAGVQFRMDGAPLGAEDLAAPFTVLWDTTTAADGVHTLTAVARDAATNQTTSAARSVTVANLSSNLVAAFAYDEGAGTTAADGSGNNNTATVSGASWSTACRFGTCLAFNGTSSFVETPDADGLTPGVNATFEAWVVLTAAPSEIASVFNKWDQTVNDEYIFGIDTNRTLVFAWQTTGGSSWPSSSYSLANSTGAIPLNTLTHIALVRSGTTVTFYINGTPEAARTVMDTNPFRNGTNALRVGGQDRDGVGRFFAGRIDEVRLYGQALTQADVQRDMATTIVDDVTPPVVSAVAASGLTAASATIGWTTNEASDSQVDYGPTTAYGTTSPLNGSLMTAHSVSVSALAANTTYHFRVRSKDAAGNLAVSGDFTFTTLSVDTTPPVISGVSVSAITSSGATFSWTTNEASDTEVEYGPTTAYGGFSTLNATRVTAHTMNLSGLSAGTLYHYRVRSRDAAGNLGLSGDLTFTTLEGTPPTVAITAPAQGAMVSGTVTVTATASDNVGVVGVQFRVDGVALGAEDTVAPYAVSWNTSTASPGSPVLTAVARDAAGNQRTSSPVTVTVATADVTLAWNPNSESDLDGYRIKVGTSSGSYTLSNISVGNVTSYTVTGLPPGDVYYFAVTAVNLSGAESVASNEVSASR